MGSLRFKEVQEQYQKMVVMESGYWSLQDKIKEAKEEREKLLGTQTPVLDKAVRLDRVSFAYAKKKVLREVSLTFSAGQITAIIGPSGTGKTRASFQDLRHCRASRCGSDKCLFYP